MTDHLASALRFSCFPENCEGGLPICRSVR